MTCNDVLTVLDAHAANALNGPLQASVSAHLAECSSCRAELGRIQGLVKLLRAVQIPEPSADFTGRIMQTAIGRARRRSRIQVTGGLATAALLVIGVAIGLIVKPFAQNYNDDVMLTAGLVNTVALRVDATRPIENVRFLLVIPKGFELAGHEGQRQIAWSGELKQGFNRLKLRLTGRQGSTGVLVASVRYGGQKKNFRVMLRTSPEASAGPVIGSADATRAQIYASVSA